jgi:hypothetical protein
MLKLGLARLIHGLLEGWRRRIFRLRRLQKRIGAASKRRDVASDVFFRRAKDRLKPVS